MKFHFLTALTASLCFTLTAGAKDTRWSSASDPYWDNDTNWSNGMPGSTDPDDGNLDSAFFSTPDIVTHVLLRNDIYLGRITFNAGTVAPGQYVIGEADGPTIHLAFTGGYYENHCSAGAFPNIRQTIAAPLKLYSSYQFYADSSDPSSVFVLGDISSGTSATVDIQLKGENPGRNEIAGVVSDGDGTVKITKLHPGSWTLSGASTFTGPVVVSVGTIVIGADVPATGASPLGTKTGANAVQLGYANPANANWSLPCAILAGTTADGTPVTIARRIDVSVNNKLSTWPQDSLVGGANTNGTSRFTGTIATYRPFFLVCASGGRTSFEGTLSPRDRPVTIGYPNYGGTVALLTSLSTSGGLAVSNGTFEVNATVTSATDVPVADGATICGTGTIKANLAVDAGGTLTGGTNAVGTLTVDGNATLATGAALLFPAKETAAPFLSVTGELSLDGAVIRIDRSFGDDPASSVVVARATGGIVGTANLSEVPSACSVDISSTEITLSFKKPTIVVFR